MALLVLLTALFWAASVRSTQVLLITPTLSNLQLPSCPSQAFLGTHGTTQNRFDVYRSSDVCSTDVTVIGSLDSATIVPIDENAHIVYVQEADIEQSLREEHESFAESLDQLAARVAVATTQLRGASDAQNVLSMDPEAVILHRTSTSALISIPDALLPQLDTLLPRLFVPVVLHEVSPSFATVRPSTIDPFPRWLDDLQFDPDIAAAVDHISVQQMQNDIRFLTGEDKTSGILSRHSFSAGARTAASWIQARIEATGATCELRQFLFGFAPNVICRYPSTGNTTATIILGAHYDSRGSFGSIRAPGANDDGSGTLSLLAIARTIQSKRISFSTNVELVAFAGEEQGLLGSRAYAKELRSADANVTLMIQADMLAYHQPGEPPQLALPRDIGTPGAIKLVANVSAIYSPELYVGYTKACCSDHQSFFEQGYAAVQVFERVGPIADPMYHNSGDLSNRTGYDLNQVRSIAKVTFATLLHTAGYELQPKAEASG